MGLNFFSELPWEILLEIFNKQSAQELLASRALGPKQQMAADWVLFSRQNAKSLAQQTKFLEEWNFESAASLKKRFKDKLDSLKENLWLSLQSPSSDPNHRILGLIFLGKINNRPISINPELIESLMRNLNNQDYTIRVGTLRIISSIVSQLNEKQLLEYIDSLILKLHGAIGIQEMARESLSMLVNQLNDEQLKTFVDRIISTLDHPDDVRKNIAVIAKKITPVQLTMIINHINLKTTHDDKALMCLSMLSEQMDSEQLAAVLSQITVKLNSSKSKHKLEGLNLFSDIVQRQPIEQLSKLITQVCLILEGYDEDEDVRTKAFTDLAKIGDKMTVKQKDIFFSYVITQLEKKSGCAVRVLKNVVSIVNHLTEPQIESILASCSWIINGRYMNKKALINLSKIAIQSNAESCTQFVSRLTSKTNDEPLSDRDRLLARLLFMSSKMTIEQIQTLFNQLIEQLKTESSRGNKQIFKQLYRVINVFNDDQLIQLMPLLTKHLNYNEFEIYEHLLKAFGVIADKITTDKFAPLIDPVINELIKSDWFGAYANSGIKPYILSISKKMTSTQITQIINKCIESLNLSSRDSEVNKRIGTLTVLFTHLNETQLNTLVSFIFSDPYSIYGEKWVSNIANKMSAKQFDRMFFQLIEQVDFKKDPVLYILLPIAKKLDERHMELFWPKLIELLNNGYDRDLVLEFICLAKEQINELQLIQLINIVAQWNEDKEPNGARIGRFYTTFIPLIEDKQLIALISNQLVKLLNSHVRILNAATLLVTLGKHQDIEINEPFNPSVKSMQLQILLSLYHQVSANNSILLENLERPNY
ncbi:MAG: hypothetical protein P4L79_02375 [Legionella sp.]|uniref:hypothetical protein n=1 Tax=Legionella sp. TaxID=459 RepID=UPI0028488F68|nr:hypothetical protein [Legionella sp.]